MPHKRAKRSAREQQRKERGADLAPPGVGGSTTLSTEGIPKSISRVLDAARIRAEYRQKKRARQLEGGGAHDGKKLRRVAADSDAGKSRGESLKHFNRCAWLVACEKGPHSICFQESRGPHASAGAIRNACFCRDRAQGTESGHDPARIKGSK
ncbi:hypothetical protein EDB83DRAFT_2382682 [Lactarius deliciosus]|nr:hypothetical protein EDB83DRAFT_2382682 [Lactarius deliciosus]